MRKRRNITHDRLRELVFYDGRAGTFTWLPRRGDDGETSRWNSRYAGKSAGVFHKSSGYHRICVEGVVYQGHRLAWFYAHGRWPSHMIDHVDGNPLNNAISNLREATMQQNQANRRPKPGTISGLKGVTKPARSPKWLAKVRLNGRDIRIGRFDTKEEAAAAYHRAAVENFGAFARSK